MTPDEFRALGGRVVEWIARYMERVESLPVTPDAPPGRVFESLPAAAPERPESWDAVLADIDRIIEPGLAHWQSPGFFGYFPASASGPAILGELLSAGLGVQGMLWSTSPACTELETRVMDWLAEMLGLPAKFRSTTRVGAGVIQGSASEAALVAMLAARERAVRAGAAREGLVAYASSQAHSSIAKAAMIAGLGRDAVRQVGVDTASLAMDPDALGRAVRADRDAGRTPFFVCATLGTTSSTAIDRVAQIAPVAAREGMWLHIDAAFAGAMLLCPEHRWMIEGVESASSFNFNPHKWMLVNFDCSALWVADRRELASALSVTPEYLRNPASDSGAVIDYRDWQAPLGRRFRALKLWFVIRHYGVEGLRAHIREHLRLAAMLEGLVVSDARFELAAARTSSLVCLRLRAGDEATRELLRRVNATRRFFLTHTVLPSLEGERHVVRVAIGSPAVGERHVRALWETLQREAGVCLSSTR